MAATPATLKMETGGSHFEVRPVQEKKGILHLNELFKMMHACHPDTQEVEVGGFDLRPT
jgi:hypothetical protein